MSGGMTVKKIPWKKLLPILALLATAAAVFSMMTPMGIQADFGDFGGDNDYGGGGDWGGGGGDYGGSSSDSDGDGIFWIIIELFRLIYRLFGWPGVIIFTLILIGGYMLLKKKNKNRPQQPTSQQHYQSHQPNQPAGAQRTDASTLHSMSEYLALDPEFSEAEFKEKLSNMYVHFQNSWQAKDMSDLRPYLTDAMYAQFDRQLDNYRQNKQTNRIERIAVLDVTLRGWKQQSGNDVIVAELRTRIVDYVVDDTTGVVIRGSNTAEKFMTYEWTLVRTSGQTTGGLSGLTAQTCPHCGAKININHSAKCEYCDSILTVDTFDWVVSGIKGISQQTRG